MSNKPLQISWNTFSAGMNDQKYQGQPGRYYQGVNVDTRRFDVRPNQNNQLVHTYPDGINCIYNLSVLGVNENVVWTNDGEIYIDDVLEHTLTSGIQGTQIGTMKVGGVQKLYYFHDTIPTITPKYIHRSNVSGSDFEEAYRTYDSTEGNPFTVPPSGMRVLSESERIIFTHYNKIFQIDNADVVTELISLASNENVVGITEFLGEYKIYTSTGFTSSAIYTWDGVSSEYNVSVKLNGMYIGSVANRGAFDFMLADGDLYKVSGVQYQKIYDRNLGRILGVFENDIYLNHYVNNQSIISKYGNEPGYKESITPAHVVDYQNPLNDVGLYDMTFSANDVFYSVGRDLYKIGQGSDFVNFESYLESLVFVGESIEYRKQIEEARIKFSGATDECIIKVSFQLDENGTWIDVWQGKNGDITGDNHGLKIHKNNFLNPIGNFNTIRIKVSFIQNGNDRARFYGIDLLGTQNLGR